MLIAFARQKRLRERPPLVRYAYIACLVCSTLQAPELREDTQQSPAPEIVLVTYRLCFAN